MEEKKKSREIDVIGIVKQIWEEKKLLAAFIIVFALLGIVVAKNRP